MNVPPPDSLKLDASTLLEDVRERLAERHPVFERSFDETHPAWIVLQEAAWMVQNLSEQLDEYPWAVLQQFAHLLGARLRPAQPSIGFVTVEPSEAGVLTEPTPGRWRFFSPRTEDRDLIEFSLAEQNIPVMPTTLEEPCRVIGGELYHGSFNHPIQSQIFSTETITWTLLASASDRLESLIEKAIERLTQSHSIGWLQLSVRTEDERVILTATLDVNGAFASLPPVTTGGDVHGDWGTLDNSTWTPDVRIAPHPLLSRASQGERPMAGQGNQQLLIPNVPAGISTCDLLIRDARPAPDEIADAIWTTLVNVEARLSPLRPTAVRGVRSAIGEPSWVNAALKQHAYSTLIDRANQSVAQVNLGDRSTSKIRLGWTGAVERLRTFAIFETGIQPGALPHTPSWQERFPDAFGALVQVQTYEVEVPEGATGLVLVADGQAKSVLTNPLLLINAPVVRDGREITIERSIPEPVHLLYRDVVTPSVLMRLCRSGLDSSISALLQDLSVCHMVVEGEDLLDYHGTEVDPSEGRVIFNAPDEQGITHAIRRGKEVLIDWYRHTDADNANLPPGSIVLVEQAPTIHPQLEGVTNPLATSHGSPREGQQAAIDRVFGPPLPVPITPGDWERLIRQALGPRSRDWLIRAWSYAERSLMSTAIWPPESTQVEAESERLRDVLQHADPHTLLVALGPSHGSLQKADLSWARGVIQGLIREWSDRIPMVEEVIVTALWPLRLQGGSPMTTPAYSLRGLHGNLVDAVGRSTSPPRATLLLNAAIVEVIDA